MHRSSWTRLTVLALATVLLALVVGPLADHHFAERFGGHGHLVVPTRPAIGHEHLFDVSHSHGPGEAEEDGIGIVPAGVDGVVEGGSLFVLVTGMALVIALGVLVRVPRMELLPAGALAAGPPRRPPRV